MKEKRITKLYEGMTSKQKAVLTLHYIAENNAPEIGRIRSTVPWKEYRCIDGEYTDWRDQLMGISMVWGLTYWQTLFAHANAVRRITRLDLKAADDETLKAFDAAGREAEWSLTQLVTLQAALKEVCSEHGIDPDDAIKIAGVPVRNRPKCEPDASYQAEIAQKLRECLPE
jgi:hypothetical protein